MPGTIVDAETAVRDFLMTSEINNKITNSGSTIKVYCGEFNPDSPKTCIMVRDAGGWAADAYMRLDYPMIQVWVRSDDVDTAKTIISRIDDELHRLGPKAISDDVFCLCMLRNTGKQRLDDPITNLVRYFILYTMKCRRIE